MDFTQSLAGMVEAELMCASPEEALENIRKNGIDLYQIQVVSELCIRFTILRKDYNMLKDLSNKRGYTLNITGKRGIFWNLKAMIHRPVLLAGMGILLAVNLWLPGRILFVRVEGNAVVPDRMILEAAESCGIRFGAKRVEVRSEQVKNALLSSLSQLQWAGVNTRGCTAVISIREKQAEESNNDSREICSIIASQDGVVTECTVLSGELKCAAGQAVQTGQILISAYTDCGLMMRATAAEGEIYADTDHTLGILSLKNADKKGTQLHNGINVSFLMGKKRIFLWKDSRIDAPICDRMYEEYYVQLPGGFSLPLGLCVERISYYTAQSFEIPMTHAQNTMEKYASHYLSQQMVAGRILEKKETVSILEAVYQLCGEYHCNEMIGRVLPEKIGAYYGKNS